MITLQNFIRSESEIGAESALYHHAEGAVKGSPCGRHLVLSPHSQLGFGTYFNLFSLAKWNQHCTLTTLFAEISGEGDVEIRVRHATPDSAPRTVHCEQTRLRQGQPHVMDLSAFAGSADDGVLYLELQSGDEPVTFTAGRFATRSMPESLPRLAVSITTFGRVAEVRATVARLRAFLDGFAFGDNIHVQVVDNGQNAGIEACSRVTPFPNRNLGGAGGFARGLAEAERAGFTHCLFMDDDAAFHMENILRTYMFLALARDPATALAGAMIANTRKWEMWENGAWFDGSCRPLFIGTDLRDRDQVVALEHGSALSAPETHYGGWWFFAFPIAGVCHYPFPFFVRGDDISFSLANDFRIATLNGVVSFQDDFTEKESPQTLYLDLRNHLVHHLVFPELERSAFGTAKIALRFMMRSLLRCHYESATAQLLAWRDVMRGPAFFDDHIDMSARRETIRTLTKSERWQDIAACELTEAKRFSRLPRKLRHHFGLITLNGHLLPLWSWGGDRLVLPLDQRGLVFPAFGARQLVYQNAVGDRGYTVIHDKLRFFRIAAQMTATLLRFMRDFRRLTRAYRQGYGPRTTSDYWKRMLG